jgi:hypothetical protein
MFYLLAIQTGLENSGYVGTTQDMTLEIGFPIIFLLVILVLAALLFILRPFIRAFVSGRRHHKHTVFNIRLPKEKPGDKDKELTVQMLHEEIARGETIFAAIGGLKAERGFKQWLFGRSDHVAFEVVANKREISFYIASLPEHASYLEQLLHAYYPEAMIEPVDDYNIFNPKSVAAGGILKTKRHFIYPLRTYKKMDIDPMNAIVNTLSKLGPEDGIAIQYLVRSAHKRWHRKARRVSVYIRKGKTLPEALRLASKSFAWIILYEIWKTFTNKDDKTKQNNMASTQRQLTQMEDEALKNLEEKNAKAGLDVNLRIVVSARDKGAAKLYLDNLTSAYNQMNYYDYGNSFLAKPYRSGESGLINDFIYRRFSEWNSFLLNTEELASLYHLPSRWMETPNISWLTAKSAVAPANSPTEGLLLGKNSYRGTVKQIFIKRDDRRRHMYIIGKSGVGKSQFMAGMAIQDILNGDGVCVLDPHGDLIEDIIARVPPERAEDVILFAPADTERPLALNLMEFNPKYPEHKTFVINEMIKIFDKLYDLKSTGGPIFEQYMRNAMLLVMSDPASGSTLMEIPKVLSDPAFRRMKLERCSDPTVVDFWRKEAEKAGGEAALANVVPYITSKLTQFISNDMMRPIIGQQKSSFELRDVMDNRKILLVNLAKGLVGEMNAYLLGMILVGKILISALSRTDMPQDKRKDFYLYIDEFQNFTTDSINSILSEARKYNLNLIVAHQYIGQLVKGQDTSIKDAVFGNAGTIVAFKIGSEDAQVLVKEFAPVFNEYDLINVEKFTAYIKLLVDNTAARPFSLKPTWPLPGTVYEGLQQKIKALSRLKYGQDRSIIEAEIMRRAKMTE